jgi:hypothetical protein
MARWIVQGSQDRPASADEGPESVSEPFMTSEGAKSFARLLTDKGYAVVVRVLCDRDGGEEIIGPAVVAWMNSKSELS